MPLDPETPSFRSLPCRNPLMGCSRMNLRSLCGSKKYPYVPYRCQVTGITCGTGQAAKRKGRLLMMPLSSVLILLQGNNLKTGTRVQRMEGEFSRSVPLHHFYDKGGGGSHAISHSKKQPLAGKEGVGLLHVCVTCSRRSWDLQIRC